MNPLLVNTFNAAWIAGFLQTVGILDCDEIIIAPANMPTMMTYTHEYICLDRFWFLGDLLGSIGISKDGKTGVYSPPPDNI